jgi:hypothetical protein
MNVDRHLVCAIGYAEMNALSHFEQVPIPPSLLGCKVLAQDHFAIAGSSLPERCDREMLGVGIGDETYFSCELGKALEVVRGATEKRLF